MSRSWIAICAAALLAATTAGAAESEQDKKDHEELRGLLKIFTNAFNTRQLDGLIPHLHKNFSVTMVNQDVITTPQELKGYVDRQFNGPNAPLKDVKIQPEADILTNFFEGRIGINRGGSTDTYTLKDGRVVTIKTRWTGTVIKDEGKWRILNAHIGLNILDNPILDAAEALKYVWGGVGLGIGLLVGILGTLLLRRRS
jgi:hypothetical protein